MIAGMVRVPAAFRRMVILCGIMAAPIVARADTIHWDAYWATCEQRGVLNRLHGRPPRTPAEQYCWGVAYMVRRRPMTPDPVAALEWFRKAAKQNHPGAQTAMGYLYETGTGVQRNLPTALWWYRKAAARGDPDGLFNLGLAYKEGIGMAPNRAKAEKYYRRAAARGSEDAKEELEVLRLEEQQPRQ